MENQTRRAVVGYDGSEGACAALDWAAAHAQRRGLALTVLHVVDHLGQIPGTLPTVPMPDRVEQVAGHAAELIAAEGVHRARKNAGSIDITALTHASRVAYALIENSRGAVFLAVGTHGYGVLAGAILGSVAFTVSGHAQCPVVIVRGDSANPPGPDWPVVVGVDASPGSNAALRFAAETAAAADAALLVVSGYQAASSQIWVEIGGTGRSFDSAAREAAELTTETAVQTVRKMHPDLRLEHRVLRGAAVEALTAAAFGAGLLVVGARGRGGFAGLNLGSVSHGLIHASPCPIAVVPILV